MKGFFNIYPYVDEVMVASFNGKLLILHKQNHVWKASYMGGPCPAVGLYTLMI